jgi:hypothetical protein
MPSSVAFRLALPALALASTAACGPLPLPYPVRAPRAQPVAVTVTEVPENDSWQVGYVLPFAAEGVDFLGPQDASRRARWGVGLREGEPEWHVDGGRERLCFTRPARGFSVGFRTWSGAGATGPPTNVTLSDGSRLLYTGDLLVRPLARCGAPHDEVPPVQHRFTFRTTEERSIRVQGQAATGELTWQPEGSEGRAEATYVYFGSLPAVETEAATVLLDPGLPAWVEEESRRAVPRLIERYASATATLPPLRPLAVVAWGGAETAHTADAAERSLSAQALPGLLLASAAGPGWDEETPQARREAFLSLARAAFHLWDAAAYPPEEGAAWLSEAAADHFATEAAIAAGVLDRDEARRALVASANDCLVRLAGRSVAAAAPDDSHLGRSCGAVAMAAAGGALRRAAPAGDLGDLFRRLFEHAAATGGYGPDAFLGGLRELHADPRAFGELWHLVRTGDLAEPAPVVRDLLAGAGVATDLAPPEEATVEPATLGEVARRAVGRCYCGEEAEGTCDPAEVGARVSAIAGQRLDGSDPRPALESLRSAVARGAALPVVLDGEELTLFCADDSFDPAGEALLRATGRDVDGSSAPE